MPCSGLSEQDEDPQRPIRNRDDKRHGYHHDERAALFASETILYQPHRQR